MPAINEKQIEQFVQKQENFEGKQRSSERPPDQETVTRAREKEQASIRQQIDDIAKIEAIRKEWNLDRPEEEERLAKKKQELQEQLVGLDLQQGEKPTETTLEKPGLSYEKRVELFENIQGDIVKIIKDGMEPILDLLDHRKSRVGGFDIINANTFNELASLCDEIKKIDTSLDTGSFNEDILKEKTAEQKKMLSEIAHSLDAVQIEDAGSWQSSGSQGEELKDIQFLAEGMHNLRTALENFNKIVSEEAPEYEAEIHTLSQSTEHLEELEKRFEEKAISWEAYMRS